jgi:hypothetical protein
MNQRTTLLMMIFSFAAMSLKASVSPSSQMVQLKAAPEIGKHISPPHRESNTMCMTSSAQMDDCFEALIRGVKYTLSYRKSAKRAVTRLYTDDIHFQTPRGLHVGDLVTLRSSSELLVAPYFEVYAVTDEQWMPLVGILDGANWTWDVKSGKLTSTRIDDLHPTPENPIQLRILGFVKKRPQKEASAK